MGERGRYSVLQLAHGPLHTSRGVRFIQPRRSSCHWHVWTGMIYREYSTTPLVSLFLFLSFFLRTVCSIRPSIIETPWRSGSYFISGIVLLESPSPPSKWSPGGVPGVFLGCPHSCLQLSQVFKAERREAMPDIGRRDSSFRSFSK